MPSSPHILALVGSYRKGGTIDMAVDEILASAREHGATTKKVYLVDKKLSLCTNCRSCTQQPGESPGLCVLSDAMEDLLKEIEWADAFVLGSPMNAGTVTAVMKTFIERLICFAYWPWGAAAPKSRLPKKTKQALILCSSAAPSVMARFSGDVARLLKTAASMMGARVAGRLFIGLAAQQPHQELGLRAIKKARLLGARVVSLLKESA